MIGRISVKQPSAFQGSRSAHASASSRSRASRNTNPPSCSLVSMNGPSVTRRCPPVTRTVVAVCDGARPSHASSTPASRAASSNSCHAAISRSDSSGEKASGPRSSPYSVSRNFISTPPWDSPRSPMIADHAEDERPPPDRQRQRANLAAVDEHQVVCGGAALGAELVLAERGVEAPAVEQLAVGAVLDEPAVVEHEDEIG